MRDLVVGDLKVINAAIAGTAVLSLYWGLRFAVLVFAIMMLLIIIGLPHRIQNELGDGA